MLATLDAPARRAVAAAEQALAGELSEPDLVAGITEPWGAWWVLLILAGLNVVLAIWRPRFSRK